MTAEPPVFRPLTPSDLESVADLARRVWQDTYPGIISQAQIDSMLAARYHPGALGEYLAAEDRWFELAETAGQLAAFCACERHCGEYKLDKLYVDPVRQRNGLGGQLIARAAERARSLGFPHMILAVNKRNAQAIAAYRKHGFSIRESVCVEIGGGFVMDDYIMQKPL